ncbi:MAG: fibronectin type III domain-containing protein [Kiritimatiellae bacterium]|nr:fibronectin type III domain-containing protein [Kiritimatiellia bacterium]
MAEYVVVRGDTLSEIAYDKYSSYGASYANWQAYMNYLVQLNNIKDPDYIVVGQKIKLDGTVSTPAKNISEKAVIKVFGEQSDSETKVLYVTWSWDKGNVKHYEVKWYYDTGDYIWFVGNSSTVTDKQCTYNPPGNAKRVKFIVRPVSETHKVNDKDTVYWTATWSNAEIHSIQYPPAAPTNLSVTLGSDFKLTASATVTDEEVNLVQFEVVKDDVTVVKTGKSKVNTQTSSYSCTVTAGGSYKVRCRAIKGNLYSEWTTYSTNYQTVPAKITKLTQCKASSTTSIFIEWSGSANNKHDVQYTLNRAYFDGTGEVNSINDLENLTSLEIPNLVSGNEYFIRVRAKNDIGASDWSEISSCTIGGLPAAPTTWSSTTSAVVGEPLLLYWIHNAKDNSSQTFAELELIINDVPQESIVVRNTNSGENKDKTLEYSIDTSSYQDGAVIKWRVRTAGVTESVGDWSMQRIINIYAPPTLEFIVNNNVAILGSFPLEVSALAGPSTQTPISYSLTIVANEGYETVDNLGNDQLISPGDEVYSEHFDISKKLYAAISASDVNLDNNKSYTITCLVAMNSGLTVSESFEFTVNWTDQEYEINAELFIDEDNYSMSIGPYAGKYKPIYRRVDKYPQTYRKTDWIIDYATDVSLLFDPNTGKSIRTETGEEVYSATNPYGASVYCCIEDGIDRVNHISLSVYRREFDGRFTELATGVSNTSGTFITDPHPALDYARYRIVAIDKNTGAVSYRDMPSYPIGCDSVIIQWGEAWSNFDVAENEDALERPVLSGSMLKLHYNVDISDNHKPDVSLVEYIGRNHPVSYYGTQRGETSTWSMEIEKDDAETLYALRRLSVWPGDVYIREPSGSGYWASVSVSFNQTHNELTIPVSIEVVRVEGGA